MRNYIAPLLILTICFFSVYAAEKGLRFETPRIESFHPLEDEPDVKSLLVTTHPKALKLNTTLFKDTAVVDFEKRQITFRRYDDLGYTMWEYHYAELSDYLLARRNYGLYRAWHQRVSQGQKDAVKIKNQPMKLQWELPVQYPSWAQRVLGNDPPRLTIRGSLELAIGFDNSSHRESANDNDPNQSSSFIFEMENYSFSISGTVGRLINLNIGFDSQTDDFSMTDNLKNFKIEYKESRPGELEDEIIQEVIAGHTGFSMPGQGLAGYSENHEGLFGIKVKSKLGPLMLTSIASYEQGENQKLSTRNKSGDMRSLTEDMIEQNRFFFLNNEYRRYYNRKYGSSSSSAVSPPPKISELQVWRKVDPNRATQIKLEKGRVVTRVTVDSVPQPYEFERLVPERHYHLRAEEGWIRFVDSITIQPTDHIAIYLRTESGSINKGTAPSGSDSLWNLWTLKPIQSIDSAGADPERFYLMWKNVYTLPALQDYSGFILKVFRRDEDTQIEEETDKNGKWYTDILGISKGGILKLDERDIFDKENGLLIIPPYDTSFFGNEPFRNKSLGDFRDTVMYTYSKERRPEGYKPFYVMRMSGSAKQTTFDLGWGVMPGTERVTADNQVLKRDRDYIIDYEMGHLELISPLAKAATNVDIEYQREALFVPDKKVFLGMHGELKLPFISEKSFIGASILYQNVSVTDRVPRLEQEPYNKVLYDVNTRIDLEPEWMTSLVNWLPLVKTEAQSSATFDFELAYSRMNPNTDGAAYIDDFEDSKRSSSLYTSHESWYQASPPFDSLHLRPPAWDYYWFTPRSDDKTFRIPRNMVWKPDSTKIDRSNDYQSVLRLHCTPAPDSAALVPRYKNAWTGIMTPISYSFSDKEKDRYFEFLMRAVKDEPGGKKPLKGKLLIQMGTMREDLSLNGGPPNGMEDREDTSYYWTDRIDSKLDLGLDRLHDRDEFYLIPGEREYIPWDTLWWDSLSNPDPSRDNYRDYANDTRNYRYVCRTQGNNRMDSEDINFDGTVQTHITERYYQFTIDLSDTNAAYIDKTAKLNPAGGFRKYRIPLKELLKGYEHIRDSVNGPSWSTITMVRLIWNGFDSTELKTEQQLVFSEMEFVGNQWEAVYDSSGTKIEANAINNQEDLFYWNRSVGKYKQLNWTRDSEREPWDREGALRINFRNLGENEEALVTRNYSYQELDFTAYRTLNLLVFGRDPNGGTADNKLLYDGKVDFVFRFGSDDSTYYEYRSDIVSGWQEVKIDLKKLATLKDDYMVRMPDSSIFDSLVLEGGGRIRVKAPKGRQPNFSKIVWMGLGVVRENFTAGQDSELSSGELWVNEMKLEGIGVKRGWAMRANAQTKWADLLDVNAGVNYEDGDFRRMTENILRADHSTLTANMSSTISLNKFLPQEWGVSIPVGASIDGSISRPQLKNNTDVYLTDESGRSDNLVDMFGDLVDMMRGKEKDRNAMTDAEHYETQSKNIKLFANYSKNSESDNPLVNLTADRIAADFVYSVSNTEALQGPTEDRSDDYAISTKHDKYSVKLRYDLSATNPPEWTKWRPFSSSEQKWLPKSFKNYELSLLPERFSFNLADVNYGWTHHTDTKKGVSTPTSTFNLNHGVTLDYSPIAPLIKLAYTLNIQRDLRDRADGELSEKMDYIFKADEDWKDFLITYGEKSRSQHASVRLNPQFLDWLSTSAEYAADYKGDIATRKNSNTNYINGDVRGMLSFNSTLNIDQIFRSGTGGQNPAFFDGINKTLDKLGLRRISFTYSASSGLTNYYLSSARVGDSWFEFFKYQLGITGRGEGNFFTGDMNDNMLGGMRYRSEDHGDTLDFYRDDRRTVERKYSFSSGLSLKIPFEIYFTPISVSWNKRYEVRPDTLFRDTSVTCPEISVSARTPALMKLSFFRDHIQNFDLNSNFSFRKTFKSSSTMGIDTVFRFDWSPLLSFSGTVKKWPIRLSGRLNYGTEFTMDTTGERAKENITDGQELDISYEVEQNSRLSEIKLLTWTIPVRGRTTMGINFSRSAKEEKAEGEVLADEMNFSITPHLSYIFTDNVTGRAEWTFGKIKTKKEQERTNNRFLITVKINF